MFNKEEFAKNKFIIEKIKYEFLPASKADIQPLHIAFNINDAFFMQMGVAATSILENNRQRAFCFHVFCDGVSEKNLARVRLTAQKYQQNFYIYIMDMQPLQSFHIKTKRFSRVTYLRSIMPKILQPLTDKFIYMDADMICLGDIGEIERINLKGYPLAAVSESAEAVAYKTGFLHQKSGTHFNDGLMLIDIAAWEKQQITERVWSYQGADPSRFSGQSQDIMNLVLDGELCFTERRFNQYADNNIPQNTLIIHFLGRDKPWEMVICECDRLWRHYLDLSCWDSLPDPLPPKKPEYYHCYKRLAKHERARAHYGKMLGHLFWYSVLKIKLKLGLK